MAIPSDPSVTSIIADGMVEGGQYEVTSSSAKVTTFQNAQFQTIKTDLWNVSKTDKLLETTACLVAPAFTSLLTLPTDFDTEIRLTIFDADTLYRGTAQAGSANTITFASTFSATPTDIEGRYIFITGGTGSGQYAQLLSYNDTTKVATMTANWTTQPDSTSTYLIQVVQYDLERYDYRVTSYPNRRPAWYSRVGTSLYVYPAPDKVYPILLFYRSNITRLDEASALFVKHLRERRSLWLAGIRYYTGLRYDEERSQVGGTFDLQYKTALAAYAAETVVYDVAQGNR